MKYKVKKIVDRLYHIHFENKADLFDSMLRMQEHYESPEFKGKIFTLGQYREWYCKEFGGFTYYTDWSAYNLPSHVLDIFRLGLFDPLSDKEKEILNIFPYSREEYSIICTTGEEVPLDTLDHEICHGMYYLNKEYKERCGELIKEFQGEDLERLAEALLKQGYHAEVVNDEMQAYLSTGLSEKHPEVDDKIMEEFRKNFNKYKKVGG